MLAHLETELENLRDEIQKDFTSKKEIIEIFPKYNDKNTLLKTGRTAEGKGIRLTESELKTMAKEAKVIRINVEEFNPGSRKQIGTYLQELGWEPKEFTPTGQPKVDETILAELTDIPQAILIANYLTLQKRIAMMKS